MNIMTKYPIKHLILLLCCGILFAGFELWRHFSPLQTHQWNTVSLKEIHVENPDDFTFAVFGDNRNSKEVFEKLLMQVDHDSEISFAIDLGDLVQTSKKNMYNAFIKQVKFHLAIPLITAIGNHEYRGSGPSLYKDIFGPLYYSFKIGNNIFIVLDNGEGKGFDTRQRRWLEKELDNSQAVKNRIVFMHFPLYDPRGEGYHHSFPDNLSKDLSDIFFMYGVTHIFSSHIHAFYEGKWLGIPFSITGGAGAELIGDSLDHDFFHYLKVHIRNGKIQTEVVRVPSSLYNRLGRMGYMYWQYLSCLFRFYPVQVILLFFTIGILISISWKKRISSLFFVDGQFHREQ